MLIQFDEELRKPSNAFAEYAVIDGWDNENQGNQKRISSLLKQKSKSDRRKLHSLNFEREKYRALNEESTAHPILYFKDLLKHLRSSKNTANLIPRKNICLEYSFNPDEKGFLYKQ